MKTVNLTNELTQYDKVTGGYNIEYTIDSLRKILDELSIKYGDKAILKIDIDAAGEYPEVDFNLRYYEQEAGVV